MLVIIVLVALVGVGGGIPVEPGTGLYSMEEGHVKMKI
jgi:hypothetical protein